VSCRSCKKSIGRQRPLTHGARRQLRFATFGMPEAGQVYGYQVRVVGETVPHLMEGEQAFGPRLKRSACSALSSLSAKRIFKPSIVRNCGSIDVSSEVLIASTLHV
jgi:hypothetical protein